MPYYTYILFSQSVNKCYVGSCEDVETRLNQHNSGRNKSTAYGLPWVVKKIEEYSSRADAVSREALIKRMKSRKFIEQVINGER